MKVFLSSTYNDLIEHRKAAHDALEQLGLQVVWMESFGARPIESTKACLNEVEECELFVGIYAYRYGHISEGKNVSITEEEFNHAQKLGKPIFGFIIKDDFPWQPKYIEYDKKAELDSLLIKVKKQPVDFFTTPDNLASGISSSIGHYLLSELEKQAQGEGKKLFERLKQYVDSTTKKRIEDDISSFLVRLKKAISLAKTQGVNAFSELVRFSFIRASLLTQTRGLPEEYYSLKAKLDGIAATEQSIENIGNLGLRALAYAALASNEDIGLELKNEFARRAIELTRYSGGEWEQSGNQSRIGCLLINSLPEKGIEAFKLAIETIKKTTNIPNIDVDIFETPIEEFEKAYKRNPSAISTVLNEFVSFVGNRGGFVLLLGFAKTLHSNEKTLSQDILKRSYLELTKSSESSKPANYKKDKNERKLKIDIKQFIEISLLLGENQLAENVIRETKFDFETENILRAIENINNGNFEQALKNHASQVIRKEVIISLFALGRISEGIKLLTLADFDVIDNYVEKIIKNDLLDELILKVDEQKEKDDFFSFAYDEAIIKLRITLARELHSKNLENSRKIFNELLEDSNKNKEKGMYKFPYWGEAALIMESELKWGEEKSKELVEMCIDNFHAQLQEAEELSKKSHSLEQKTDGIKQVKEFAALRDKLKEFGEIMSLKSNNFIYAWFSYKENRDVLIKRLESKKKPTPEIVVGRNHLENNEWNSLQNWISEVEFSKTKIWKLSNELIDMVRELVFKNKLDLAKQISEKLEGVTKWQADTWISVFPMLTTLDPYDLDGFDDPDHIFLIKAEAISKHSPSIASAYVSLYCEYIIKEQWLSDMLGWDLCNLALFLYKQNNKANAHKYFVLGIQHWFQYASETEETWNEIVEKLAEVDFDLQFLIAQDILIWNSTRNIEDVARSLQMCSMFIVKNFEYGHVVDILKAIKRSRDWHLEDEIV